MAVLPLQADGYDMSAMQFRDQLAIRYHREPAGLPSTFDRCGAPFIRQHALDCAKGGLVKRGHDVVQDNDTRLLLYLVGDVGALVVLGQMVLLSCATS